MKPTHNTSPKNKIVKIKSVGSLHSQGVRNHDTLESLIIKSHSEMLPKSIESKNKMYT